MSKINKIIHIRSNPDGTQNWLVETDSGDVLTLHRVSMREIQSSNLDGSGMVCTLNFRYDFWDDDVRYGTTLKSGRG